MFVPRALPGERRTSRWSRSAATSPAATWCQSLRSAEGRVEPPVRPLPRGLRRVQLAARRVRAPAPTEARDRRRPAAAHRPLRGRRRNWSARRMGMLEPWRYRNQARFTVGRRFGELCFTYRATHRLLRIDHCWIVHPAIDASARACCRAGWRPSERRIHQVLDARRRQHGPAADLAVAARRSPSSSRASRISRRSCSAGAFGCSRRRFSR